MPHTKQLLNHWRGIPGPFVQWNSNVQLKKKNGILDRIKPVLRRFKLNSSRSLYKEQLCPWNLVQLQDDLSQHRGGELWRLYGLLARTTLLSLK